MKILLTSALLLCAACASRPEPATREPEGRDYYSANRESWNFLKGTFKQESRLAKQSFETNWNLKQIRRRNARIQKESLVFLGHSLTALELENARLAWAENFPRGLKGPKDFGGSVRFGFLDSGD